MRVKLWAGQVLAVCLLCLLLASCGGKPATHVLFIGNSFTYYNGGIDKQLAKLTRSIQTSSISEPGYTLEMHWTGGNAIKAIDEGHWAYVVLQEQSQTPVIDRAKFQEYVSDFNQVIEQNGAKTILLMTWERPDSVAYGVTTANLAAAYDAVGTELGIKVAPVGLAFAAALQQRPDLVLYGVDGHPTMYGTYLAACVLYGTITGHSPVGIAYADSSISPELRDFFQRIAAQSLGQ
jgi:hypothetical protein